MMMTMMPRSTYAEVLRSKSLTIDSSDSEGCLRSQDTEEVVQTSPSPTQSSGRRRQKRQRNASELPSNTNDSSTTQSDEEDAISITGSKLFVGEIPRTLPEKDLTQIFEAFENVKHTRLFRNKDGTSKVLIEFVAFPSFPCTVLCHSLTLPHLH